MQRVFVACGVLAVALACRAPEPQKNPVARLPVPSGAAIPDAPRVSLIQVIANPEAFDGKRISVAGWANIEFEGDALYFHEEDFRFLLFANAVRLSIPEPIRGHVRDQQGYMGVTGTFNATAPGSRGRLFRGWIAVEYVEWIPSREELRRRNGAPE
ncbi:MAG: hypothetical protein ABW221_06275 [Vicinamibacteria bacterium]